MPIEIDCHGESHVGRHRPANEDQFLIADLNKSMRVHQTSLGLNHQTRLYGGSQGKLLLVADGLGGHASGERASTLAVDGVANYILNTMDWLFRLSESNEAEFEIELKAAFRHSQAMVEAEAKEIPQRRGMATTLTLAYVDWPNLYVVHVGDTRCYLVRDESITCLTTDHTLQELARMASANRSVDLSDDDTRPLTPTGHALWNVIGGDDSALDPQFSKTTLVEGDALLLCSDGLTRYLTDKELRIAVGQKCNAKTVCEQFIETANERGGKDNITTVLARFNRQVESIADIGAEQGREDEVKSLKKHQATLTIL